MSLPPSPTPPSLPPPADPGGSAVAPVGFEEEGAPYTHNAPDASAPQPETGVAVIRRALASLDDRPGVYRMLDKRGDALYVGKARALRKRVATYGTLTGHSTRIRRMIHATASLMTITTQSEAEALLLEANLIKQLKPRCNVLLRDDKSFPYILIRGGHDFPQLTKHRGARRKGHRYFGPFASAGAVNRTLTQLQKAFLLRSCSDSYFANRTRPCLLHQIKRCCAPCVGAIGARDYAALIGQAEAFLSGRSDALQKALAEKMRAAAAMLDFERAALYRDRIQALSAVQSHQEVNPATVKDADVIALACRQGQACVQVFFYRAGQNRGNRAFFPRILRDMEPEEICEAFLGQFYARHPPARRLILDRTLASQHVIEEALSAREGRAIRILVPRRGEKRRLIARAEENAANALARHLAQQAGHAQNLAALAELFDLKAPPARVEIYDNSHVQGSHAVGAMVVAGADGFEKASYRKFNIRVEDFHKGDDFAMLREMLTRRFARLLKDREEGGDAPWPDLLLIDGGAGQCSAANAALAALGLSGIPVVGIAKGPDRNAGRERIHKVGRKPFSLPERDARLHFLQRLRDEAHRFAIGAHRKRRAMSVGASPLDAIETIGPKRKRALLQRFGSARAVSRAGWRDLAETEGISDALAQRIHAHFHGESEPAEG